MNAKHTLTVLNRLANRKPKSTARLEKALQGRLDKLANTALEVAVETGDPIGRVMARKVKEGVSQDTVRALLDQLGSEICRNSVPLRELGLAGVFDRELALSLQTLAKSRQPLDHREDS